MTETEQTLRQRFTAFLQAMYDWETEANRVDEEEVEKKKTLSWEDFCKKQTELRIPIYKEYITERERKYGGAQYASHIFPPNYDPSKETITEEQFCEAVYFYDLYCEVGEDLVCTFDVDTDPDYFLGHLVNIRLDDNYQLHLETISG